MGLPSMDSANAWSRVAKRVDDLERELAAFKTAAGTLASATISRGGLTITDPDGSRMFLGNANIRIWDDYANNPTGYGRIYTGPATAINLMRLLPPYTSGNGLPNAVVIRGTSPSGPGELRFETDGVARTNADGGVIINAGDRVYMRGVNGVDIVAAGSLRIYEISTTGSAANLRLDPTTREILIVTSSARYKQEIEDAPVDTAAFLKLRPRSWRDRGEVESNPDTAKRNIGFIAEEVDALGLPFVDYDVEGRPDALQYDRFMAGAVQVMQEQAAQIAALVARLDALEATP